MYLQRVQVSELLAANIAHRGPAVGRLQATQKLHRGLSGLLVCFYVFHEGVRVPETLATNRTNPSVLLIFVRSVSIRQHLLVLLPHAFQKLPSLRLRPSAPPPLLTAAAAALILSFGAV